MNWKKLLIALQKWATKLKFGGTSLFTAKPSDPAPLVDRPIGSVAKALTDHWAKLPQHKCVGTLSGEVTSVTVPSGPSPNGVGPSAPFWVQHQTGAKVTVDQQRAAMKAVESAVIDLAGDANTSTDNCHWRVVRMEFVESFGQAPQLAPSGVASRARQAPGPEDPDTYLGIGATVGLARCCRPGLVAAGNGSTTD